MTPDPLETALRKLVSTSGPPAEAVAFRAGELAAGRRARRRHFPVMLGLMVLAVGGWGTAWRGAGPPAVAAPPSQPIPDPPAVTPAEPDIPPGWRERYARLDRLAAEGLSALGPAVRVDVRPRFTPLEEFR